LPYLQKKSHNQQMLAEKGIQYYKSSDDLVESVYFKDTKLVETLYRLSYRIAKVGKIYALWSKLKGKLAQSFDF
jgi:hypothetical protein